MEKVWFVYTNDIISGPYSTRDLEDLRERLQWNDEARVLHKGDDEWVSLKQISQILKKMQKNLRQKVQEAWFVAINGQPYGPMNEASLISYLKNVPKIHKVLLWTAGQNKWHSIFSFPQMIEALGISRRKTPRVDINARVLISTESSSQTIAKSTTISQEGIGIKTNPPLPVGENVNLLIQSPTLMFPIHSLAKVVYAKEDESGVQFCNLHYESKAIIIDYIKSMQAAAGNSSKKAA